MAKIDWLEILNWGDNEINDLRHVAYSYIKQGIYDVALTFFDALSVLTQPTVYDLQTIGALHLQLGHGIQALDFLDRALKIDPTHEQTLLNKAKALFMLGYKSQAMNQLDQLQESEKKDIASQAKALMQR